MEVARLRNKTRLGFCMWLFPRSPPNSPGKRNEEEITCCLLPVSCLSLAQLFPFPDHIRQPSGWPWVKGRCCSDCPSNRGGSHGRSHPSLEKAGVLGERMMAAVEACSLLHLREQLKPGNWGGSTLHSCYPGHFRPGFCRPLSLLPHSWALGVLTGPPTVSLRPGGSMSENKRFQFS